MLLLDFITLANNHGFDVYSYGRADIVLQGNDQKLYFDGLKECAQWLNNL